MNKPFMQSAYKNLSGFEHHEVKIIRWVYEFNEFREPPAKAIILKDYPKTVLFELIYTACQWGVQVPPRKIYKMIPKAAMAIGDVVVKDAASGIRLVGNEVAEYRGKHKEPETFRIMVAEDLI